MFNRCPGRENLVGPYAGLCLPWCPWCDQRIDRESLRAWPARTVPWSAIGMCWARRLLKTELPRSCELLLLLGDHRRAKGHRDGKAGCHYQSPHREPRYLVGFSPSVRRAC